MHRTSAARQGALVTAAASNALNHEMPLQKMQHISGSNASPAASDKIIELAHHDPSGSDWSQRRGNVRELEDHRQANKVEISITSTGETRARRLYIGIRRLRR